jgi:hypothetical protein
MADPIFIDCDSLNNFLRQYTTEANVASINFQGAPMANLTVQALQGIASTGAKKGAAKKGAAKKAAVKTSVAKKGAAKTSVAKKGAGKKSPAKKGKKGG